MNTQQRSRSQVASTDSMLRIIIPARVEILALPFLGLLLGFLLAFCYAFIADSTAKLSLRIDRVDAWINFAFGAGLACFAFPISREFLLALGGRREVVTLTPSALCIRFSTLGMIQNKEFAPDEVRALRLAPQKPDEPWPGGYIQFWYRGKGIAFARQVSYSEAEVLIHLIYRTGFLPNA